MEAANMTGLSPKELPLRILTYDLYESAANTLTEKELPTGVSAAEGLAMAIWRITWKPRTPDPYHPGDSVVEGWLNTRQGLDVSEIAKGPTCRGYIDGVMVSYRSRHTTVDTTIIPIHQFQYHHQVPLIHHFDPPIYVADDTISLYVKGTNQTDPCNVQMKLEYEVIKVGLEQALRILEMYR